MRLILASLALLFALPAPALNVITCTDASVAGKSAEPWPNCKSLTKVAPGAAKAVIVNPVNTATTAPVWVAPGALGSAGYVLTDAKQANGLNWVAVCSVYPSACPSAPPVTPPPASTTGQASLTWSPSTTAGVAYNLYRGSSATSYSPLAQGVASPYVDKTPLIGSTYVYLLTASNSGGESVALAAAPVTIKAPSAAPAAGVALKATSP